VAISWARMGVSLIFSVLFSLIVGTAAATNRYLEKIIIPALDILQSIPILGFFPVAIQLFYNLSPVIGPELSAIFLIFTSQVWNITFAVYESIRVIRTELLDTARFLGMNPLEKFRYIYVPASLPRVVHNIQPSWANGIFFLVGSEILTFGETEYELFGLGTLVSRYAVSQDINGLLITITTLIIATVFTTMFVFIPLARITEPRRKASERERSLTWYLLRMFQLRGRPIHLPVVLSFYEYNRSLTGLVKRVSTFWSTVRGLLFYILGGIILAFLITRGEAIYQLAGTVVSAFERVGFESLALSSFYSLGRVAAAVAFSVAWSLPTALAIAWRERLSTYIVTVFQVIASIPVTVVYPIFASYLAGIHEPRAFLMLVAATQWYVFFQVLSGLRNIPSVELEVAELMSLRLWDRLTKVYLPRALPPLVTGCITAAGGAWNGLIVAERLVLGELVVETPNPGLGKLLSNYTYSGDLLGSIAVLMVMSTIVVLMNRLFWKRLYDYVVFKLKIEERSER